MDRYSRTGVMAAGLISGVSIYIVIPYLRTPFRRFSEWVTGKPSEVFRTHHPSLHSNEEHNSLNQPDSLGSSHSNEDRHLVNSENTSSKDSKDTNTEANNHKKTETSLSKNEAREQKYIEQQPILSKSEESEQKYIEQQPKETNNLPENAKQLINDLETFNIFTETVAYKVKEDRHESDKTIYCKNLFLKDRKGKFFYVIVREDSNVNLRQLKYKLHAHRNFSFASTDEVIQHLQLEPGCITPFTFMSDSVSEHITVAISRELMFEKKLNFHPLHPGFATRISFGLLLKLFGHLNRKLQILDI